MQKIIKYLQLYIDEIIIMKLYKRSIFTKFKSF